MSGDEQCVRKSTRVESCCSMFACWSPMLCPGSARPKQRPGSGKHSCGVMLDGNHMYLCQIPAFGKIEMCVKGLHFSPHVDVDPAYQV